MRKFSLLVILVVTSSISLGTFANERKAFIDTALEKSDKAVKECFKVSMDDGLNKMDKCIAKARKLVKPDDKRGTVLFMEKNYDSLGYEELRSKLKELTKLRNTARRERIDYAVSSYSSLPEREPGEVSAQDFDREVSYVKRRIYQYKKIKNYKECMDFYKNGKGNFKEYCLDTSGIRGRWNR